MLNVVPQRFCGSHTTKKGAKDSADELFDDEDKDDEPKNEAETSVSESHVDDESEIVEKSSADSQTESSCSTTDKPCDTSAAVD